MKTADDYLTEITHEAISPLPKDRGEPVFRNSWEAEAFAIGNLLVKSGFLSRSEWMNRIGEAIKRAQMLGDPDRGDTYYSHWMDALESLCVDRGLTSAELHADQVKLWDRAIENTPHGVAIALENAFNAPEAPNPHLAHPVHGHRHHHHHHHHHHGSDHSHEDDAEEAVICKPRENPPSNFYAPAAIHRPSPNGDV